MSRKTWINILGIILSTTIVGLVIIPVSILATPVILIRPSIVTPLYNTASERFMKAGTQMVMKGVRSGRAARI